MKIFSPAMSINAASLKLTSLYSMDIMKNPQKIQLDQAGPSQYLQLRKSLKRVIVTMIGRPSCQIIPTKVDL